MRLLGKNTVVYGAGWGIGREVALAFAGAGARVYLAGRARDSLRWVAHEIKEAGGRAEVTVVDPLDPEGIERQLSWILHVGGTLDVSFNLTSYEPKLDPRLTGLTEEAFSHAAFTRVRSNFITATAAARKMAYQGTGAILARVDGTPSQPGNFGGFAIGSAALAEVFRQLEKEVGPRGVRIACLSGMGTPEHPRLDGLIDALTPIEENGSRPRGALDQYGGVRTPPAPIGDFASASDVRTSGRMISLPTAEAVVANC
ncbi:MAG TPA: SDR family oxidoreductase [Thermoplasmata archaeon]|nr:SDR family oxidoreductase [Thermoplasmata archaeon]